VDLVARTRELLNASHAFVPGSGREWIWDDVVLVEGVRKPLRTFFYTIPPLIGVTTP